MGKPARNKCSHSLGNMRVRTVLSPIWEANHVWLILVVVILFTAFPAAFALITSELHVPITVLLIAIVLRGSAFTFQLYDEKRFPVQQRWRLLFAAASIVSPFMLGTLIGAISSGHLRSPVILSPHSATGGALMGFAVSDGRFRFNLFAPWLNI